MTTANAKPSAPRRKRLYRNSAVITRWLHVYLSMVSFAVVLFFAATGLTLNHPAWFANAAKTTEHHGVCDKALLQPANGAEVDKLAIVELLRTREHASGAVTDFRVDDQQISVSFKAPGYTADAFFDHATGHYDLTEVRSGFIAVINDLHKGRDSGKVWSALIDVSAILLVLVSLTGLVLIWFVYKRRLSGLILAAAATAVCVLLYKLFVP